MIDVSHLRAVVGKRVFVGLSGGVDSAVSAALLQKASAHVTGVFIKGWYPPGMPCTWADDRRDAMRVAAYLGIPFHTLDASDEYKKGVIDYLIAEYAAGRTPNPDSMCNREVKFGAFYDFARSHGTDYIATGHYARTQENKVEESVALLRGSDTTKDQSYFLWAIPPEALAHTLFPIGALEKRGVREMATTLGLPVSEKKDSQGICFLGSISVDEFLRRELNPTEGKAVDEHGREVGVHDGALLYTLGQRIALHRAPSGPWYVIKKDMRQNILTVSKTTLSPNDTQAIMLTETNWFTNTPFEKVEAQYRYHGPRIMGVIDREKNIFTPTEPLREAVASGQSLVVYVDDHCIGGGIIA